MEVDEIQSVTADEFAAAEVADSNINILDVRKKSEYYSEHIVNAENAPLDNVNDAMASIDKDKTYFVHCAGGYRSMIFASILKARGFDNLINVAGGFSAIKASEKFKITDYVCPTTML
jgi:rhodanese-related sulfurtransferase